MENVIKPTLKIGQYVKIGDKFYKVIAIEPIPLIEKDFGALAASGTGSKAENQEVTDLYLKENRLAEYYIYPYTNGIKITIKQPKATSRYATKNAIGYITHWHTEAFNYFLEMLRIWIFEDDNKPYFTVENISGSSLSASKVYFFGFQYELEKVETVPEEYFIVPKEALG